MVWIIVSILPAVRLYCILHFYEIGKWAIEGMLKDGLKGDSGLVLKSKAKHAAIAASLDRPFSFNKKPLVIQYDVTFQNGQECGGAYIKLLTQETGMRLSQFNDKTPYTIMFGPDKCGNDHKVNIFVFVYLFCQILIVFIFIYRNVAAFHLHPQKSQGRHTLWKACKETICQAGWLLQRRKAPSVHSGHHAR